MINKYTKEAKKTLHILDAHTLDVEGALQLPETYYVALDTETTGIDMKVSEPVQLSMIIFTEDEGELTIIGARDYWREPSHCMTEDAQKYTGITESMYAGRSFPSEVLEVLLNADLIIAHNAAFDRAILTNLYPDLSQTRWGCSQNDIDWKKIHIASRALEFIVYKYGYSYTAHTALIDTLALYTVLAHDGNFNTIKRAATGPFRKISLTGNTYQIKDELRRIGFLFDYTNKYHYKVCKLASVRDTLVYIDSVGRGVRVVTTSLPSASRYAPL